MGVTEGVPRARDRTPQTRDKMGCCPHVGCEGSTRHDRARPTRHECPFSISTSSFLQPFTGEHVIRPPRRSRFGKINRQSERALEHRELSQIVLSYLPPAAQEIP